MREISFFRVLSYLENTFEFNSVGNRHEYSQEVLLVFLNLKKFVVGCSWTQNENFKYIVRNRNLTADELSEYYYAEFGKTKAAATFRVQRAEASKLLTSILGGNLEDIFFGSNIDELKKLNNKIMMLSEGVIDANSVFISEFYKIATKPFVMDKVVCIEDCEREILLLRGLTKQNVKNILSFIDINKLTYIMSVLSSDCVKKSDGKYFVNRERIKLLSQLKGNTDKIEPLPMRYSESKNSVAEKDQSEEVFRLKEQLKELQDRNYQLKKENEKLKAALSIDNGTKPLWGEIEDISNEDLFSNVLE